MTKQDIDFVRRLATEAGEAIMVVYAESDFSKITDFKADNSPLTLADKKANDVITAGLKRRFPEIPILSEEGAEVPYETRRSWDRFWLVDPLDGTKEFIKRNGEFTVNIALVESRRSLVGGHKSEVQGQENTVGSEESEVGGDGWAPNLGVVYVPVTTECFWNEGDAAFTSLGDSEACPMDVMSYSSADSNLKIIGSRSHQSEAFTKYLDQFDSPEVVAMGSSLKFMLIAKGGAHIYPRLGPTMEWDTGAAEAVLTAAGGSVLKEDGSRMEYNKENLLNPFFIASGKSTS